MSFLQALDTAIAMTLIYFLLSLVVTALTEVIATHILRLRSRTLYNWVVGVVRNPDTAAAFYNHPLIRTLEEVSGNTLNPIRKPSYIPNRTFAIAVLDFLEIRSGTLAQAQTALEAMPQNDNRYELARTVLPVLDGAVNDITKSQEALAAWFDSSMDRVSGWYKRRIAWTTFLLSLLVTVLANASTLELIHNFWNDQDLRNALVSQATKLVEAEEATYCTLTEQEPPQTNCIDLTAEIEKLPLPLGWNDATWQASPQAVVVQIFGWLLTAILISFGSRFWFDALSKLVNIRLAGQKPSESETSDKKEP